MEFIAREVKRSKKKKRLHAFPPDKPDFNSKGLYILKFSFLFMQYHILRARNCDFVVILVLVKGVVVNINFFPAGKSSKTKSAAAAGGSRLKAFDKELTDTSKKALKTFRQRFVTFKRILPLHWPCHRRMANNLVF